MTDPIKCELHIGDAVYTLDEVTLYRDHTCVADCDDPMAVRREHHAPMHVVAVVTGQTEKAQEAELTVRVGIDEAALERQVSEMHDRMMKRWLDRWA